LIPNFFNKEQIQVFINLIHFPSSAMKEEVANLLMIVSPEFEDDTELMEI
jgi:hypothetical protein